MYYDNLLILFLFFLIHLFVYKVEIMRFFLYNACLMVALQYSTLAAQSSNWHSTGLDEAWLSCIAAPNPNSSRGTGHWLSYDFGQVYRLTSTRFWNFNVPERVNSYNNESWSLTRVKGKPEDGIKEIVIDYSFDGKNWKEWTRFELPKASASPYYEGIQGPDLGGLQTRYLLITALSNHGGSCFGLSEVRFDVQEAPSSVQLASADRPEITLSPNPFDQQADVSLPGFPVGRVDLRLTDLAGRVLSVQTVYSDGNGSGFIWSPGTQPPGMYLLQAVHELVEASLKIEIIR